MKKGNVWYKSISNWIIIIACVLLIPILVINLYIMIQSKTNPNDIPGVVGYKPFIVLSGSMESKIHKGDLIFVKEIDPSTLKVNDVIAYRDGEDTVTTHRIIDIVENNDVTYFITKGDNNATQDLNLVAYEDVEGIYTGRFPGLGSMMNSLSKPTTIIVLVLVITVAFGIGFTISNKKIKDQERLEFLEYKRMKEQQEKEQAAKKTKNVKSIKASEKKGEDKKTSTKKTTTKKNSSEAKSKKKA